MHVGFEAIVGVYRLVVTPELLAHIDRTFVEPALDAERPAVREAALAEAHAASLEIDAGGGVASRAGGHVLYRSQVAPELGPSGQLELVKPGGERVTLWLADRDTLLAEQLGRPTLTFKRAKLDFTIRGS